MSECDKFIELCIANGLKMTPQRRVIVSFLYQSEPQTAYELLEKYRASHGAGDAMTIYRALAYLEKKNLVHKIHSQNKYTLCDFSHIHSDAQFFLCQTCHQIKEIHSHDLEELLKKIAQENHFNIQHSALELLGICNTCQHSSV